MVWNNPIGNWKGKHYFPEFLDHSANQLMVINQNQYKLFAQCKINADLKTLGTPEGLLELSYFENDLTWDDFYY